MSFTEPCDVSDDVIPGHVKIITCDMLSVWPCIRFILIRRLLLNHKKDPKWSFFLPNGCENTILGAVQRTSTIPAWCQQRLGTFSKGNHSSFCIWCRYLVALYKKWGYILDVLRPQQLPEDVIETVSTQNWYNHIIGFDTSFHSMV